MTAKPIPTPPDRIVVGICPEGHLGPAVPPNDPVLLSLCNECGEELTRVRYQFATRRAQR
jgi:hypothetical protein